MHKRASFAERRPTLPLAKANTAEEMRSMKLEKRFLGDGCRSIVSVSRRHRVARIVGRADLFHCFRHVSTETGGASCRRSQIILIESD